MDTNYVTVKGPHGRHIQVHKKIQAALPDHFPLVGEKTATAANETVDDKKEPENGNQ